jgi:hypothetical protein
MLLTVWCDAYPRVYHLRFQDVFIVLISHLLVGLRRFTSLGDDNVAIVGLVILQSILYQVEHSGLIQTPIGYHLAACQEFKLLNQVDIQESLKDKMLKWPNHVPNGAHRVL